MLLLSLLYYNTVKNIFFWNHHFIVAALLLLDDALKSTLKSRPFLKLSQLKASKRSFFPFLERYKDFLKCIFFRGEKSKRGRKREKESE